MREKIVAEPQRDQHAQNGVGTLCFFARKFFCELCVDISSAEDFNGDLETGLPESAAAYLPTDLSEEMLPAPL